jgi:hypothetical protein
MAFKRIEMDPALVSQQIAQALARYQEQRDWDVQRQTEKLLKSAESRMHGSALYPGQGLAAQNATWRLSYLFGPREQQKHRDYVLQWTRPYIWGDASLKLFYLRYVGDRAYTSETEGTGPFKSYDEACGRFYRGGR